MKSREEQKREEEEEGEEVGKRRDKRITEQFDELPEKYNSKTVMVT